MANLTIEQRLAAIGTGLNAPSNVPQIGTLLAPYGYAGTQLGEGTTLLNQATALANQQKTEYGEQYEATKEVEAAWNAARAVYGPTLALARVALRKNVAAQTALAMTGKRKESLSGWIDQATTFYSNLLANAGWVAAMANLNRDEMTLQAEQAVIQTLVVKNREQEAEKGEAQEATRERDAKLDELYEWYADYRDVAVVALEGHPEWIELIRQGSVE